MTNLAGVFQETHAILSDMRTMSARHRERARAAEGAPASAEGREASEARGADRPGARTARQTRRSSRPVSTQSRDENMTQTQGQGRLCFQAEAEQAAAAGEGAGVVGERRSENEATRRNPSSLRPNRHTETTRAPKVRDPHA